jgi:Cdc6-like AAA superfamily ATPase
LYHTASLPEAFFSESLSATVSTLWRRITCREAYVPSSEPSSSRLYGRDDTIDQIIDKILIGHASIALLGPPGIGKTAVAEVIVKHDRILCYFGSRIKWIQCCGLLSANQLIDAIYDAFASGSSRNTSHSLSEGESLRNILADQSYHLIVLDGFDHLWESSQSDVEYILHHLLEEDITVMVTMQGSTVLPPALWQLRLAPLSIHNAKKMFYSICPPSYRCSSN